MASESIVLDFTPPQADHYAIVTPTTEWNEMDREHSDCAAKQCAPWGGKHQRRRFTDSIGLFRDE